MDDRHFDALLRALQERPSSRRRTLSALLIALGVPLVPARKVAADQANVTLCHKRGEPAEKTQEVPRPAVTAHLGHGDTFGACPGLGTTPSACAGGVCQNSADCIAPCLCSPFGVCAAPNTCPGGLCSGGPGQQGTCESAICDCSAATNGRCEAPPFP